jgi:acyl phosphate:glycerol-3-phosphate acyltransferase
MMRLILMGVIAYVVGSVPFGFLVGKARGVDLRTVGSGNIGSTNIYRALGLRMALLVFALDAGKGLVATRLVAMLGEGPLDVAYTRIIAGLAVIVGSVASVFMRFRGGKGVATGAGVFLGLEPAATGIAIALWAGLVAAFNIVSVGSLAAAVALPLLIAALSGGGTARNPAFYLSLVVAAVVIVSHRSNIRRLVKGQEKRVGRQRSAEGER